MNTKTAAELKSFLEIPYDELEDMNLKAGQRAEQAGAQDLEQEYTAWLKKEKHVKAVTLCFSDIEGRLHMLDYDKKFLLDSLGNLTFDGSSIRGFSHQHESDLRLALDWSTFYWLPSDVFGPGKVLTFAKVLNRDGSVYPADFRSLLAEYADKMWQK